MSFKEDTSGSGNWELFDVSRLAIVEQAATEWKSILGSISKPWLCWCVDPNWCLLQQHMVMKAGWTPVVGVDSRSRNVKILEGAVYIDFYRVAEAGGTVWMHFPLEFVHLFCERLAFWHSDLLPPLSVVFAMARQFEQLQNGQVCAVPCYSGRVSRALGRLGLSRFTLERWFELAGCTTRLASQSQFVNGCGWWRNIAYHPNAKLNCKNRRRMNYDHGTGILYWQRYLKGRVSKLAVDVEPYHYDTRKIRNAIAHPDGNFDKAKAMTEVYNINAIIKTLGIDTSLSELNAVSRWVT
jgi:hypothetical protein